MALLVLGFGAGVLVVFLLRMLAQYERASIARLGDTVAVLVEHNESLERRLEVLEAIAVGETEASLDLKPTGATADTERAATGMRTRS